MIACCRYCRLFERDRLGDGFGVGKCGPYEQYKAKNPSESQLRLARIKLGNEPDNDLFWGGDGLRDCEKFEERK